MKHYKNKYTIVWKSFWSTLNYVRTLSAFQEIAEKPALSHFYILVHKIFSVGSERDKTRLQQIVMEGKVKLTQY